MRFGQRLLAAAVASIVGKSTERAVASLFSPGGTHALKGEFAGINDFEVLAFLVILPGVDFEQPGITRIDFAVVTVKFQKPGDTQFSSEDRKACVLDSQFALNRLFADGVRIDNVKIDVTYIGEADGSFWVEFAVAVLAVNSTFGGLANTFHALGVTLEASGPTLNAFMQNTGQWLQGTAWRFTPQPGGDRRRPGCFGIAEWLDRRTRRCRDCGFLGECVQLIEQGA